MNQAQIRTMQRLTTRAQARAEAINDVPMVWTSEPAAGGKGHVWLIGSNTAASLRWFDRHRFVMACVGPRGGVKFYGNSDKLYTI